MLRILAKLSHKSQVFEPFSRYYFAQATKLDYEKALLASETIKLIR
jgi:hypothetical protein